VRALRTCKPAGQEFCNGCGQGLATALAPAARDPRAYTPQHLAAKILQSRAALEGERKQVTVLFADVKGSMELAEHLDPEVFHRVMERFAALLAAGIHRFEGTVTQFTGDGIQGTRGLGGEGAGGDRGRYPPNPESGSALTVGARTRADLAATWGARLRGTAGVASPGIRLFFEAP
jgi:class 3 adenylate cyclase